MKSKYKFFIYIVILMGMMFLSACNETQEDDQYAGGGSEIGNPTYEVSVSGVAQKGPFLNGSTVEIYELDEQFTQTAVSFQTRINSLSAYNCNITMRTPYADFYVQGYYFDEIEGHSSNSQLEINAIADIRSPLVNINILTALSEYRILYLIDQGMDFDDAKAQAQTELLTIFGINDTGLAPFENMDMLQGGDSHAVLLAVSAILMQMAHDTGSPVTASLSEIMAEVQFDIEEDGVINIFNSLNEKIEDAIKTIDVIAVRYNLENRYQAIDPAIIIPDFEKYITGSITVNWTVDCSDNGISEVKAEIYDTGNVLRWDQVWECDAETGTIQFVNAGEYEKIVLLCLADNGSVISSGEKAAVSVTAGEATVITFLPDDLE